MGYFWNVKQQNHATMKNNNIMSNIARGDYSKEIRSLIQSESVKKRFAEILGKSAPAYLASLLSLVNATHLKKCDPASVMNAAQMAAALNLPINPNLGFAWIIPYKDVAQFQIGYKGFKQLAVRSGMYAWLEGKPVREGQIIITDNFLGFKFDWTAATSERVVGYGTAFHLLNGYEKTIYATVDEIRSHGQKYSKTFKSGSSLWQTDFPSMAMKTMYKRILSGGDAPLSIEMQTANIVDQAVIIDPDTLTVEYPDNPGQRIDPRTLAENKERERYRNHLSKFQTLEEIDDERIRLSSLTQTEMEMEELERRESEIKSSLTPKSESDVSKNS